jgi:hypothetical protein
MTWDCRRRGLRINRLATRATIDLGRLRDLLADTDEAARRPFVAAAKISDGSKHVAGLIRQQRKVTWDWQKQCNDARS